MLTNVKYYQTLSPTSIVSDFTFDFSKIIPLYYFLSKDNTEETYYFLTEDKLFFGVILLSPDIKNKYQIQIYTPLVCSSYITLEIPNCDTNLNKINKEIKNKIKDRIKSQKIDVSVKWHDEPKYVEDKNVEEYKEILQKLFLSI